MLWKGGRRMSRTTGGLGSMPARVDCGSRQDGAGAKASMPRAFSIGLTPCAPSEMQRRGAVQDFLRHWTALLVLAIVPLLTGCNFFTSNSSGGGGGGGGTVIGGSGANYTYVVNSTAQTVSGFLIGTGTLTATPGSPYALGFAPLSAVVTRTNNYLYVAGVSALYSLKINTDGSLSVPTSVAIASEVVLTVSPDGQWLFGLNSQSATLDEWKIDSTTGALTAMPSAPYTLTGAVLSPMMLSVSPAANYIFAALGTGGDHVFTFNTSTGAIASSQQLDTGSVQTSDNSLAANKAGTLLFIARSGTNGGVGVYTIGTAGALSSVAGSPFAAGAGTFDLTIDTTGDYLYAANRTDGTISGYAIGATGTLSALNGSPYASGKLVNSVIAERSGKYVLAAAAGGSPDVTMYGFDATALGKLNVATTTASGTAPAGATLIAPVH